MMAPVCCWLNDWPRLWQDRGLPVRHLAVQQLAPELAADIAGEDVTAVVFRRHPAQHIAR